MVDREDRRISGVDRAVAQRQVAGDARSAERAWRSRRRHHYFARL